MAVSGPDEAIWRALARNRQRKGRAARWRSGLASPFLGSLSLKARITMVLEGRFAPHVSGKRMFAIALVAAFVLPACLTPARLAATAGETTIRRQRRPRQVRRQRSEFPIWFPSSKAHPVLQKGDKITILGSAARPVRSPRETSTGSGGHSHWPHTSGPPGCLHDCEGREGRRMVSSVSRQPPSIRARERSTLILPMSCRGWPHVSFYPAGGGESFGGNYFGTGDSVLKSWWGEKE